jgi:hypothetical protein
VVARYRPWLRVFLNWKAWSVRKELGAKPASSIGEVWWGRFIVQEKMNKEKCLQ